MFKTISVSSAFYLFNKKFSINPLRRCLHLARIHYNEGEGETLKKIKVPGAVLSKYEAFRDERSPIILDVEEERRRINDGLTIQEEVEDFDPFLGINPERGKEGVIDIEEAVDILRRENAQDIFVCEVPEEYRYVKYLVVVTGKSTRHMQGMAEFMKRVFKYKKKDGDFIPTIEGKGSKDWIALDLGNIALHIFSSAKRVEYDLESLWSMGREHDELYNKPDDSLVTLLKQHTVLLGDLKPAETNQ